MCKTFLGDRSGFTLIEVLIAIVIFSLGILAVGAMQIISIQGNSKSRLISEASNDASSLMERLLSQGYQSPVLIDDDDGKDETDADANGYDNTKDGTEEDADGDGIDDNGGDFGLDDLINPDGATDRNGDGVNDTFWNIAVDYPRAGVKTLRVLVNWNERGVAKTLTLTNIKADE